MLRPAPPLCHRLELIRRPHGVGYLGPQRGLDRSWAGMCHDPEETYTEHHTEYGRVCQITFGFEEHGLPDMSLQAGARALSRTELAEFAADIQIQQMKDFSAIDFIESSPAAVPAVYYDQKADDRAARQLGTAVGLARPSLIDPLPPLAGGRFEVSKSQTFPITSIGADA
jgi:hypothetical protein